jgi:hypothetical protein
MTASPYDGPLSAIRNHDEDLGTWLGIWENRKEPGAHARRCAGDAVKAIDAMLGHLSGIRAQLVSEIRRSGAGIGRVRWVPVIRNHCCCETEDCSPRHCYLLEGPLPEPHIASCELPSRI